MKRSYSGKPKINVQEVTTELDIEEIIFKWNLKTVSNSGVLLCKNMKSPIFVGGEKCTFSWQLTWDADGRQYPNEYYENENEYDEDEYENYYTVTLEAVNVVNSNGKKLVDIEVAAIITLAKADEPDEKGPGPFSFSLFPKCEVPYFRSFVSYFPKDRMEITNFGITRKVLLDPVEGFVAHGTIPITCHVFLKYGESTSTISSFQMKDPSGIEALYLDMKNVFNTPNSGDIVLRTSTKDFTAHKAILMARSPVFDAMFQSNMMEVNENTVNITDVDDDIVSAMLEYIYQGKAALLDTSDTAIDPGTEKRIFEILKVAEKYQLIGLKEQSEFKLGSYLKDENAAEILILADMHNAKNLKRAAMQFIQRNKKQLLQSEPFLDAMNANPELWIELYGSE